MVKFYPIEAGYFFVDGGAMFGPIPKKYWERKYPCDTYNMCEMAMRCLFVETKNRKILIDTGAGNKHWEQLKFYRPNRIKDIVAEIGRIGYGAEDITDVVLTHLHFDHCGGSTVSNSENKITPTFPNATYWLSRAQWENYRNPCLYERDSFFPENIEPIFDAGLLRFVDEDELLCENIQLRLYDGHTPGQIAVFIDTHDKKIVFPGDVVPTAAHTSLGWLSAYDNHPALAMEEKQRFLTRVVAENRTMIFCHDAYKEYGNVMEKNGNFFFVAV